MSSATGGKLSGRKIVVTGAASGIGRAVARIFAGEGAALALLDLNEAGLAETAQLAPGTAIACDVADESSVRKAVAKAADAMGGIDGIVNAAGIAIPSMTRDTDLKTWQRHLDVNLTGPFLLCREALQWLRAAPAATIVTIASGQALRPGPGTPAYAASKAGVMNLSRVWAQELAPKVRCNTVCPGVVDTPMIADITAKGGQVPGIEQYAMRRVAQPEEIARAILFLTCDDSSFVNGIAMAVDGGRTYH
jgi:NAD(P)-dependent dehydrogenase (short-subunit alcohol dehydrogenase family)